MKLDVSMRKIGEVWTEVFNGFLYRMEYLGNGYVCQTRIRKM